MSVRVAAAECLVATARIPLSREQQEPLINTAQKAWYENEITLYSAALGPFAVCGHKLKSHRDDSAFPVRHAAATAVGLAVALAIQRPQRRRKGESQQMPNTEWTLESAVE